ncbi:hypothetical protein GCM10011413_03340 [Pedobacter psychrotolerans]|nr:hypothetical protein GCM10011413_03340 [Pedobacter psychrotolerans]
MCCTLLIRFLEDKSVAKINESFISMYNDRLVPATDLYFIAENLYQKNMIFNDALINNSLPLAGKAEIDQYNFKIDSVIKKYELTLLVKQEEVFLNDLKKALSKQQQLELKVLKMTEEDGLRIYQSVGKNVSNQTLVKLSALIKIQSNVGNDLIKDSKIFVSGTKIYSTLQGILAVLIGVMIVSIISASNMVKIQNEKFNLN